MGTLVFSKECYLAEEGAWKLESRAFLFVCVWTSLRQSPNIQSSLTSSFLGS